MNNNFYTKNKLQNLKRRRISSYHKKKIDMKNKILSLFLHVQCTIANVLIPQYELNRVF